MRWTRTVFDLLAAVLIRYWRVSPKRHLIRLIVILWPVASIIQIFTSDDWDSRVDWICLAVLLVLAYLLDRLTAADEVATMARTRKLTAIAHALADAYEAGGLQPPLVLTELLREEGLRPRGRHARRPLYVVDQAAPPGDCAAAGLRVRPFCRA